MDAPKKILIVEDDPDLQRGLAIRLRASGYETLVAPDGYEAWQTLQREKLDLILLDIGLPLGDGYDILEFLRERIDFTKIPVIIVSARDPKVDHKKSIQAGARAFLQKPVDNDMLLEAIRDALADAKK